MKNEIGKNTLGKIRILSEFIESRHGISLARAISMNPAKMDRILAGKEEISLGVVNKIASYFFLPPELLLDDERELPDPETLEIDVDLLSVQRNDIENDIERMKQKHFISRNWKMIGYRKRLKLILSVLLISIPLIAYIFFCISEAAYERFDDMRKYEIGSDGLCYDIHDPVQKKYHDDLVSTSKENNADAYYVDVNYHHPKG